MCSSSRRNLPPDIFQHYVRLHHSKFSLIDRNDRTVAAQMLAPPACLRIADSLLTRIHYQLRIPLKHRKTVPVGHEELQALERGFRNGDRCVGKTAARLDSNSPPMMLCTPSPRR